MSVIYEFIISLIDFVFYHPLLLTSAIRSFSVDMFAHFNDGPASVVVSLFAFWTDTDLFPSNFQAILVFYIICYCINIVSRFITRIWDLLPFA